MPDFVRRIVSGPKARHVDKDLDVDLDLVYVTERLIIMGWPASKFEALYRNDRKQVRRFLDAKHGEKYRVYNLCPCSENSYEASEFYGAVSRYPFPDHHPPPLSLIPLFVCDMTAWLAADPENVAVIHCKAGKGRSGTMACCYLLSLPILPPAADSSRKSSSDAPASCGGAKSSSPQAGLLGNLLSDLPAVRKAEEKADPIYKEDVRTKAAAAEVEGKGQAYTVEVLAKRLQEVYKMHTARRLKPVNGQEDTDQKLPFLSDDPAYSRPKVRTRSVSGLLRKASQGFLRGGGSSSAQSSPVGAKRNPYGTRNETAFAKSTGALQAQHDSSYNLSSLGVSPMGRSVNNLSRIDPISSTSPAVARPDPLVVKGFEPSTMDVSDNPSRHERRFDSPLASESDVQATTLTKEHLAPPMFHIGDQVPTVRREVASSPAPSLTHCSSCFVGDRTASKSQSSLFSQEDDDEAIDLALSASPARFAVSIPSQRRFVGYWARLLAGVDPRLPFMPYGRISPPRTVRILHIYVDRIPTDASHSKDGHSLSIQLGRYDSDIERRLHQWEVNARRRARAYGRADPSACAPTLPPESLTEHGTDFKGPARRREEEEAEARRWQHVVEQNAHEGYERKLSQHGNETGVGCWGINVLAEQERARHFTWTSDTQLKSEMRVDYFATLHESDRSPSQSPLTMSRTDLPSPTATPPVRVRHNFRLGDSSVNGMSTVQLGSPGKPTWLKSAMRSVQVGLGTDSNKATTDSTKRTGEADRRRPSASVPYAAHAFSSNETSPSASSMWALPTESIAGPANACEEWTSPPTSVESGHKEARPLQEHELEANEDKKKRSELIVNADYALQIKILAGRSGATHSRLPDMASCGYLWFIPSFETPTMNDETRPKQGDRIRCSFSASEIDFRKGKRAGKLLGGEVCRVAIEFEWVDVGEEEGGEEIEEHLKPA